MKRLWVISYDISDNTRRTRMANYLLGWGNRVLDSVFECVWRADQLHTIKSELLCMIDINTDRLWLVPVCQRCREAAEVNGQHRAARHPCYHVV